MDRQEAIQYLMGDHPDEPMRRPDFITMKCMEATLGSSTMHIDPDIFDEWAERHGYSYKLGIEWIGPDGYLYWATTGYIIHDVDRKDDGGIAKR